MSDEHPSFVTRFWLAWVAYFRTLLDPSFAGRLMRLRATAALPPPSPSTPEPAPEPEPAPPSLKKAEPDAALQLLALLQREGRFIDFVQEDVSAHSDDEVAAAARVVHEGCVRALRDHFRLEPVREEEEGSTLLLAAGFDAREVRLTGNVAGEPPYRGCLRHAGWRVTEVQLPETTEGHDPTVLCPAEVEL